MLLGENTGGVVLSDKPVGVLFFKIGDRSGVWAGKVENLKGSLGSGF